MSHPEYGRVTELFDGWLQQSTPSVQCAKVVSRRDIEPVNLSFDTLSTIACCSISGLVHPRDRGYGNDVWRAMNGDQIQYICRVQPVEAYSLMLRAACLGGVYGWRRRSAYGRLEVLGAMSALAGLDESATWAEIDRVAQECTWFVYHPRRHEYYVIDELCLIVLRPDRRTLFIVDAVDVD